MQFQAHDSYWSHYCGIVCLSPSLILSNPKWGPDRRILYCHCLSHTRFF
jgi:hypothetical protein